MLYLILSSINSLIFVLKHFVSNLKGVSMQLGSHRYLSLDGHCNASFTLQLSKVGSGNGVCVICLHSLGVASYLSLRLLGCGDEQRNLTKASI